MKITDAVILAGGKGERIKKYLKGKPKPLAKIKNYIFLDLLIKKICKYNIGKLYILAGYKGTLIKKRYHKKKFNFVQIEVIIEKKPLGTAGCLSQLKKRTKNDLIVVNGDTFFDLDISKIINFNLKKNEIFLSLVKNTNYKSNKKLVFLNVDKKKRIVKKKNSNFINGGVYKFNNFFLKKLIKKNISLENDIIPDLINKKLVKGMIFKNFFLDIGTPRNFLSARKKLIKYTIKPALFLDRDNTLIHDHGYIYKTKDLKLKKTFIKYLKKIALKKIYIFIVTNQSGIGRGYFTERQFENFQLNLKKKLFSLNIFLDDIEFCPYHEDAKIFKYRKKTNLRKPGNGMILKLLKKWPIDKSKSVMIGDQISDRICAAKSRIKFINVNDKQIKNLSKKFV